jgi:capsular polysaccharide transport system permease protein
MQSPPTKNRNNLASASICLLGILYFALILSAVAYVWLVAQDRFLSVASFKISQQNSTGAELGIAQLALPGLADNGSSDSQLAIGFVNSTDLLLELEKDYHLSQHFTSPKQDFIFRLNKDAPLEDRLDYYRKRIFAHFDKETGLTMLTVDTFDPSLSQQIAQQVLNRAEAFINQVNQSIADQQISFIRSELDRAEKQVQTVSAELLDLQNTHNIVSPDEAISASLRTVQELKLERLRIQTVLASMERDSPESPRIPTSRSQLRSLEEQIASESTKISGPEQDRLNQILARYQELQLKLDFSVKRRTGAELILEKNRMDAVARSRFMSVIQHPYLPEAVGYPQRPYATSVIIVLGVLLFLILRVLVHSIYERVS